MRYLYPSVHNPRRIKTSGKLFRDELDFEDIKFPVKTEDIHKIQKETNSIGIFFFWLQKQSKISNQCVKTML